MIKAPPLHPYSSRYRKPFKEPNPFKLEANKRPFQVSATSTPLVVAAIGCHMNAWFARGNGYEGNLTGLQALR